ncbi:hypothetical protein CAMRE0001_1706 [Campylobacter rectus RM3267]|uniref:Uncharacterized protein n=1 Tax=Campylobacter rectus RM3267 TaxID=553218 RepID=B9CZB8_CAMRE|nr:hypothetical protein CAMRE0001_1706 [Campylobacter rectus RM3267]
MPSNLSLNLNNKTKIGTKFVQVKTVANLSQASILKFIAERHTPNP